MIRKTNKQTEIQLEIQKLNTIEIINRNTNLKSQPEEWTRDTFQILRVTPKLTDKKPTNTSTIGTAQ